MKILIIDDSVMDRRLLLNVLKKNNIPNEVLEAKNGEEGLELLSREVENIAVILLDWQMPIMDGIEFMRAVISVPVTEKIPIIMITASSSEDDKKKARSVNPNLAAYITKPYKPDTILGAIKPFI